MIVKLKSIKNKIVKTITDKAEGLKDKIKLYFYFVKKNSHNFFIFFGLILIIVATALINIIASIFLTGVILLSLGVVITFLKIKLIKKEHED